MEAENYVLVDRIECSRDTLPITDSKLDRRLPPPIRVQSMRVECGKAQLDVSGKTAELCACNSLFGTKHS